MTELPMREALLSGAVILTRYQPNFGGRVLAYRHDDTSPSGKMLLAACSYDEFCVIENELRAAGLMSSSLSPLSPTEYR